MVAEHSFRKALDWHHAEPLKTSCLFFVQKDGSAAPEAHYTHITWQPHAPQKMSIIIKTRPQLAMSRSHGIVSDPQRTVGIDNDPIEHWMRLGERHGIEGREYPSAQTWISDRRLET